MPSLFSRFKKKKELSSKSQPNLASPSTPSLPSHSHPRPAQATVPGPASSSTSPNSKPAPRIPLTSASIPNRIDVLPVPAGFRARGQPGSGSAAALAAQETANYDVSPRTSVVPGSTSAKEAPPQITQAGPSKGSAAGWAADTTLSMRQALDGSFSHDVEPGRAAGLDETGHSPPFADEQQRPDLLTSVSNARNDPAPAVPPKQSAPSPRPFPLPPSETRSSPPVLPHITDVDNVPILHNEAERPKPVPAISAALSPQEQRETHGNFPHVQDLPAKQEHAAPRKSGESARLSRRSLDVSDIPQRHTSLKAHFQPPAGGAHGINEPTSQQHNAVRDADLSPDSFIQRSMASLSVAPKGPILPKVSKELTTNPPALEALESQRHDLVNGIVTQAREEKQAQAPLSDEGKQVFHAAGLGDNLTRGSDLEVQTMWMEPVVQETIIRKEHTEYTTLLEREVHKYHIYPKIQPVHDPAPIILPTRHRIFSATDGKWHEVIGDEAAIAILGEDVFYNGPQERRETRQLALPALDPAERAKQTQQLQAEASALDDAGARRGKVIEREGVRGGDMGAWHRIQDGRYGGSTAGNDATPMDGRLDWEEEGGVRTMGVAI